MAKLLIKGILMFIEADAISSNCEKCLATQQSNPQQDSNRVGRAPNACDFRDVLIANHLIMVAYFTHHC